MRTTATHTSLNNGVSLPLIGFGAQASPDESADPVRSIQNALEVGYRLLDTAETFGCETEIGQALERSGIARQDVFVQTKRLPEHGQAHDYDSTLKAFDASLERLGFDYVDCYLIHWPRPSTFDGTIAAWKAMETLLAEGRTRSIGVSNFTLAHLDRLIAATEVVPAINQVEMHPYFNQAPLRQAHQARGIQTQAWSPLGGVYTWLSNTSQPITEEAVQDIARHHERTPAQVVLRWHLQHGTAILPKSSRRARIESNFDLLGFTLSEPEMAAIDALDTGTRGGPDPDTFE